ncbi:acetyl esterase [Mumia flava]|uniref:Acetyl esterase n=1 Tax=Mumia flava TaxID=1348852 RepID=A0A0B2BPT6_9ACTN|nr:alpha/beta hydrolase [Mumia flava]PJJ57149.1 acetyl esterase [Mumia flava]
MSETPDRLSNARSRALRGLFRLPPGALARMAGPPVVRDGRTLEPEMKLLLRLMEIDAPPVESLPVPAGRRAIVAGSREVGGIQPIGAVWDRVIDGPGGHLGVRCYVPRGLRERGPALVFFHGGGFVYGGLDSHDAVCRFLAEQAGVRVVAVDYRLAPEHPYPAAVEDCIAGYQWVLANAEGLGVDRARVAVGGDSAGGNLATVVAQHAVATRGLRVPAYQLLIYPVVDLAEERASRATFGRGYFLTGDFMDLAKASYVPEGADLGDPRLSPLHGKLEGLPPAYVVTAGFDPLRDEGDEYAAALAGAGVPVEHVCEDGLIHSFANMVGLGRAAPAAMRRTARALRRALHGA